MRQATDSPLREVTESAANEAGAKPPIARPSIQGTSRLDREYGFTYRMILIARRYRAMLDEQLRPLGYGTARMEALSTIARSPEPCAQIAIAKRIGIEGPTLTRMLDTLEADGLVVRRQDPTDRRTKLIELTPEGYAALQEIMRVANTFRTSVLKSLTDDDLEQVNEVTEKLMRLLCDGAEL